MRAHFNIGSLSYQPCTIADFCAEGMLLKYANYVSQRVSETANKESAQSLVLHFIDPDSRRTHKVSAQVVRMLNGAMGICFTQIDPTAMNALLHHAVSDSETKAGVEHETELSHFAVRQCHKYITQYLEPLLGNYWADACQALAEQALKAPTDNDKNQLMDSVAQVKDRQGQADQAFWSGVTERLSIPQSDQDAASTAARVKDLSDLSLVEKQEFEDWLLVRVMITKADGDYRNDLVPLKMRLDKVGMRASAGYINPFGPALFCYSFRDALLLMQLVQPAERILLKTFEKVVLKHLGEMYQELNNILIRHKILPNLSTTDAFAQQSRAQAGPQATASAAEKQPDEPDTQADAPVPASAEAPAQTGTAQQQFQQSSMQAAQAFSTARTLFSSLKQARLHIQRSQLGSGQSLPIQSTKVNVPIAPQERVEEALGQLQQAVLEDDSAVPTLQPLKTRVQEAISQPEAPQALEESHEDMLDVVDSFFSSVEQSHRITPESKATIKRLEVPVAKNLLKNPEFFDDLESPVRKVINRLAQLGAQGSRLSAPQRQRIDDLVRRINAEFETDEGVFEEAVQELDSLLERRNVLFRRNIERIVAAAEGNQKVESAKQTVAETLFAKTGGEPVPKAIHSLLEGGWRDLLVLTLIRQGPHSQLWEDYLAVVDTLLKFARDPDYQPDLASLLKIIQEGLASISSNHTPPGTIRDALKTFLASGKQAPGELVAIPRPAAAPGEAPVDDSLSRWLKRVEKLQVGDWLRFQPGEDEPQYIRLTWISSDGGRFVFVNHQGMKVVDLERATLAEHFMAGRAAVEAQYETPLVDESLDRMVTQVYDQLSHARAHDPLTGLMIRRAFEEKIDARLAQQATDGEQAVLYIGLGQLKIITDTGGYEAGDQVVKDVADLIDHMAGDDALVGRMDGNDFAVFSPFEEELPRRIMKRLQEYRLIWRDRKMGVSVSLGIARTSVVDAGAASLLHAAEHACRHALEQGSNRMHFYVDTDRPLAETDQMVAKLADLDADLEEGRVMLRCQKIVPLAGKTRRGSHYEILLSVMDKDGVLLSAREFVRTAERYDRMQMVDRWVIEQVFTWMREHPRALAQMGGLNINLSGRSLNDENFLNFMYELLDDGSVPMELVSFELTDTSAITDIDDAAEFMEELKMVGCSFLLGDFGVGMSSYQYLKQLPVDAIKIDGSFVRELSVGSVELPMVKSMTEMAHFLGKEVVAQQVESDRVLELLRSVKVDYAQGYGIQRPELLKNMQ